MKTKGNPKVRINVITLGCSKNLVDSEVLLKQLENNNFSVSHDAPVEGQDIVILNTCGFINDAKQESIDYILQLSEAKERGGIKHLIVAGCLSERYEEKLRKEIPEVDVYFGVGKLKEIVNYLNADFKKELVGERKITTPYHFAYLKIAEGCDRKCSFCAIPAIRGNHVSKPIPVIVKEAENLVDSGVKEVILIAQDLTYYGIDLYKKRELAFLLEKLSSIKGLEWIRLQYAYPAAFPYDLIQVIKEHKNICNYLDVPFQHINDRILTSMERGISKTGTYNLIDKIRKEIPDITLRTSLIVGYPGETSKEFDELMEFVSEVRFDRLGVFAYSHEESTKAFELKDSVSPSMKKKRMERLMTIQEGISLERNELLVGRHIKVIVDRTEGDFYVGRTESDSPEVDNEILIENPKRKNIIGEFCKVVVTKAMPFDLEGKLIR